MQEPYCSVDCEGPGVGFARNHASHCECRSPPNIRSIAPITGDLKRRASTHRTDHKIGTAHHGLVTRAPHPLIALRQGERRRGSGQPQLFGVEDMVQWSTGASEWSGDAFPTIPNAPQVFLWCAGSKLIVRPLTGVRLTSGPVFLSRYKYRPEKTISRIISDVRWNRS